MLGGGTLVKQAGLFGFGYNRTNYKFDQGQRWARFTAGRANEIKRFGMFREDVSDLASVSVSKLKVYVPVLTMSLGYVLTVLVEARSGLKFPGPPTFASGLYLNCLGVSFAFMTLSIWLCWHAAMRAQIAMVQLRTRKVRLPVPSQRQLDSARKILSTYEEQNVYDMFKLPFLMPNAGKDPIPEEEDEEGKDGKKGSSKTGYQKAGLPGIAAKMKGKVKEFAEETGTTKELAHSARVPGLTSGAPSWMDKELEAREALPKASPSGFGNEAPPEPYEHFELIRQAQKDYWCAEAYARVTFLIGKIHLIQSFAYWLVLHNVAELGLIWGAVVCGSSLTAGIWIMFRMDVLPSHGGCFPIEMGGPFIEAVSIALAYTHHPTDAAIDISRAVAILVYLMQIAFTVRLYVVSQPANSAAGATHTAREAGERLFNQSASCESPAWLPAAFQHVSYLVAPPKTRAQLEQEQRDRDQSAIQEDPMVNVDMTPWFYVRVLLFVTIVSWSVLLTGRIVECIMSERMLVTNPGAPPWSRIGQWYGWESGPITSKHYAHVTPMRGHFAWQKGWGPQGQQELWASDMFGFHPEADMHWATRFLFIFQSAISTQRCLTMMPSQQNVRTSQLRQSCVDGINALGDLIPSEQPDFEELADCLPTFDSTEAPTPSPDPGSASSSLGLNWMQHLSIRSSFDSVDVEGLPSNAVLPPDGYMHKRHVKRMDRFLKDLAGAPAKFKHEVSQRRQRDLSSSSRVVASWESCKAFLSGLAG